MNTKQRAELLAYSCRSISEYVGRFSASDLIGWVEHELGHPEILDAYQPVGSIYSKADPSPNILHIVSGNAPHAAFQSVLRGLLVGARNLVKIPLGGLDEFTMWHASLPDSLSSFIEISEEVPPQWWQAATTVVAIGSDESIEAIHHVVRANQTFIAHGHKISIGYVTVPDQEAATLAAQDVSLYDQHGCLSPHAIYVDAPEDEIKKFGEMLGQAMADYELSHPRGHIELSDSGAIYNLRRSIEYYKANDENYDMWCSDNSSWTVIYEGNSYLKPSPKNRVIYLKPWPDDLEELGHHIDHLSTCAIYPWNEDTLDRIEPLHAPRVCALGNSQNPPLFWHHDGLSPLATLVKWRDIG